MALGIAASIKKNVTKDGGDQSIEVRVGFAGDGSSTTVNMPKDVMDAIQGLYLYAVKFDIPVSSPPGSAFDFDLKDNEGFSWLDLGSVSNSADSAYSGSDTHGFLPMVLGNWSFYVATLGAGLTFTAHLYFVR